MDTVISFVVEPAAVGPVDEIDPEAATLTDVQALGGRPGALGDEMSYQNLAERMVGPNPLHPNQFLEEEELDLADAVNQSLGARMTAQSMSGAVMLDLHIPQVAPDYEAPAEPDRFRFVEHIPATLRKLVQSAPKSPITAVLVEQGMGVRIPRPEEGVTEEFLDRHFQDLANWAPKDADTVRLSIDAPAVPGVNAATKAAAAVLKAKTWPGVTASPRTVTKAPAPHGITRGVAPQFLRFGEYVQYCSGTNEVIVEAAFRYERKVTFVERQLCAATTRVTISLDDLEVEWDDGVPFFDSSELYDRAHQEMNENISNGEYDDDGVVDSYDTEEVDSEFRHVDSDYTIDAIDELNDSGEELARLALDAGHIANPEEDEE